MFLLGLFCKICDGWWKKQDLIAEYINYIKEQKLVGIVNICFKGISLNSSVKNVILM
jgi:hypothetical protein